MTDEELKNLKNIRKKWLSYFPDARIDRHCNFVTEDYKFIYSKNQLHIWRIYLWHDDIIMSYNAKVSIARWPADDDRKTVDLKELDKNFYTLSEYKCFYEAHKNMMCNVPVPPSKIEFENSEDDETYDRVLEFIQLTSDERYLYKFSYTERKDDSRHEKFMRISEADLREIQEDPKLFSQKLYAIVEYMERPINEWNPMHR